MTKRVYDLSVTTQGPLYPPSEILDENGDFVVIGKILQIGAPPQWGAAIVANDTPVPIFGTLVPYKIKSILKSPPDAEQATKILYTLPLPLPANNYPMIFAPQQCPDANTHRADSFPLHCAPIPDEEPQHGRKRTEPITLGDWIKARGRLTLSLTPDLRSAIFEFEFSGLIPDSLYTVMSLRARDLDPAGPTRPAPLGLPNVFIADTDGNGRYRVVMPDPFPPKTSATGNRIINVVVLWMSRQMSHGGAIGLYGLGGDIHAQLKLQDASFDEFETLST